MCRLEHRRLGSLYACCSAGVPAALAERGRSRSAPYDGARPSSRKGNRVPVTELNHYFVRANDLERTKDFYCDVLGLDVMHRPPFPFPGYWLGVNGNVQVHMGPHGIAESERFYLGTTPASSTTDSGVIAHIAFLATDPEQFAARLDELSVGHYKRYFAEIALCQIFVHDPDGLTVELNFFGVDHEPAWSTDTSPIDRKVAT